jgi:WD40-like Beta Propeller Repeat
MRTPFISLSRARILILGALFCTQFLHAQGYRSSTPLPVPTLFAPGVITADDYETHAAFSPGGDTVYFLKCTTDLSWSVIYSSKFSDRKWSKPSVVSFSGKYIDIDPFVTADGNTIYFSSNRPVNEGDTIRPDMDIWKTDRVGTDWGKPVHLGPAINSPTDEYYPTLTDGGILYFGSARSGGAGSSDIYRSVPVNGNFVTVENIGTVINTPNNEYEPFIAPDESYLIFMATIPPGLRNAGLFISYHKGDTWSAPEMINDDVNSPAIDWGAKITRDKKYLIFGSTRDRNINGKITPTHGMSDIYQVDVSSLNIHVK